MAKSVGYYIDSYFHTWHWILEIYLPGPGVLLEVIPVYSLHITTQHPTWDRKSRCTSLTAEDEVTDPATGRLPGSSRAKSLQRRCPTPPASEDHLKFSSTTNWSTASWSWEDSLINRSLWSECIRLRWERNPRKSPRLLHQNAASYCNTQSWKMALLQYKLYWFLDFSSSQSHTTESTW